MTTYTPRNYFDEQLLETGVYILDELTEILLDETGAGLEDEV